MPAPIPAVLKECHRLRKHLRDLKDEIDRGPRVLKAHQQKLADEEQAYKAAYETLKKRKLDQKQDEGTLKTVDQHLAKLFTRSMEVTTLKEMDATKSEIAQATEKKNALEDAILAAIMDIEERTADLPNVERRWAEAQKAFADYQVEAKERLERLVEEQKLATTTLAQREAELPADVVSHYNRLIKSYGPEGLAGIRGMVCSQCAQRINEGQHRTVETGGFVCCSNCGRGLYLIGE